MHPILCHIGPIPLRGYSTMVFVGFLLALWYARRRVRSGQLGLRPDETGAITPSLVTDAAFNGLIVGIVGARLIYVLTNWSYYSRHLLEIPNLAHGGATAYGGLIFGFLYLAWYCRRHRLSFPLFADVVAPGFALAYGIGRIGCFLNGCCYGAPVDPPLGMQFIRDGLPGAPLTPPSHPAQLYSSAINLLCFGLLDRWSRRSRHPGEVFLGYLAFYCVYRFAYEQLRMGATASLFVLGLTHAQFFNLLALPIILFLLWRVRRQTAFLAYGNTPASE